MRRPGRIRIIEHPEYIHRFHVRHIFFHGVHQRNQHYLIHLVIFRNEIRFVEIFRIAVRVPCRHVEIIVGFYRRGFVGFGRIEISEFAAENIIVNLL